MIPADTFLSVPQPDYEDAQVIIQQVPFEGTVSYGKGTSKGPQAVLDASQEMELYDEELESEPFTVGIRTAPPIHCPNDPEEVTKLLYTSTKHHLDNRKFPITIGGEHSITSGEIKAFKERYPDICVLQIDAHSDLRDDFRGSRFSHACVMKRIADMNVRLVQVGIRSMSPEEKENLHNIKTDIFYAKDIVNDKDWIDKVIASLGETVFISIDVDGLDPSIMPSTGTPEPGGLLWYPTMQLLKTVCDKKLVVGIDVVELAPIPGIHAPDYLVARMIYKLIGYTFANN